MSNDYPPAGSGWEQDSAGQSNQPPPPPPLWNPQSAGTPPPSYGQAQPPAYGQPQQTSPLAIISLVLSIVGICCSQLFLASIGALVIGYLARNQIQQSSGQLKGDGLALSGMIVGGIGIVIGILGWTLVVAGALTGP